MRILFLALLPSTLIFLTLAFRPIQIKNPIRPQVIFSHRNILEVVKQGLSKEDAKHILKKLFEKNLQDKYLKDSGRGLTIKLKLKDLVKIFSEKATHPYIFFIGRIQ